MPKKQPVQSKPVNLFLSVPPLSEHLPLSHCLPVLVFTDPPKADLKATIYPGDSGCTYEWSQTCFGPYRILWIHKVKRGQTLVVQIDAIAEDRVPARAFCTVRRRCDVMPKPEKGKYGAPTIVYPANPPTPAPVPATFTTYGNVTPSTAQVSAWVCLQGQSKALPGTSVAHDPQYDWAFSFTLLAGQYTLYVQNVGEGTTSTVSIQV